MSTKTRTCFPRASLRILKQRKTEARELENTDLTAQRNEYVFAAPGPIKSFLESIVADKRDMAMAHLWFNIVVIVFPLVFAMFTLFPQSHLIGVAYVVFIYAVFFARWLLSLHYAEHLSIFKKSWGTAHFLCSHVFTPIFGLPSGMYYLHHVVMHHIENNLFPHDLSSTMPYRRDNIFHFFYYWMRHTIAIWVQLPYYAFYRKRYRLLCASFFFELVYITLLRCCWAYNAWATTYVLIVPYFITSFLLMFGNWSQHIFVDPKRPHSNYGLAYNCVNAKDNQLTFNDGYHVNHHINSRLHWADMPKNFMDNLEKFAAEDALVFEGIHFIEVGFYVFTRNIDALANRLVDLRDRARSVEEISSHLRSLLVPIPSQPA